MRDVRIESGERGPGARTDRPSLGRREFLAVGAAGLALAAGGTPAALARASTGPLPARRLGRTGRELPMLAYGGAALPRAWLNPLTTEQRVELVRYAFAQGIRYFDTAGNYMESQTILGQALRDVRDQVYLVTKVETTYPADVRRAVEQSLRELQTDRLDAVLIHGTPGIQDMKVPQAMKVHSALTKLRDERMVQHIGLSAHGYFDKALELIGTGGFDLCMLAYGYLSRGYDQVHSARSMALRDACLARAHELDMGIAAMKVVAAGLLGAWATYVVPGYDAQSAANLPGAAIRHVLADDRIDVLVIGMRLPAEIDANVRTLVGDRTYTAADRALLAAYCARVHDSEAVKKLRVE